jgi:cytochrome bd ubiquinol oxidase subunit II
MELIDLTLIWVGIIGFGVFMYVLMDGFDLGVGILFPFAPDDEARDMMMNSVAPVWDGNETWLILGGAGLLAAFPLVYTVFLPALYIGVFLLLAGLIFRGIAFEFRFKANTSRYLWNWAFFGGSTVASFAQGAVVGAYIQGFETEGFRTWAALRLADAVHRDDRAGLGRRLRLLGATWTIMKTEGETQDWAYRWPAAAGAVLGSSSSSASGRRWPTHAYGPLVRPRQWLWIFPVLTRGLRAWLWRASETRGRPCRSSPP